MASDILLLAAIFAVDADLCDAGQILDLEEQGIEERDALGCERHYMQLQQVFNREIRAQRVCGDTSATTLCFGMDHAPCPPRRRDEDEEMPQVPCPCVRRVCRRTLESVFKTRSGMNRRAGRAIVLPVHRLEAAPTPCFYEERGGVCGLFITNRSARASKDHHCIFGLQTSSQCVGGLLQTVPIHLVPQPGPRKSVCVGDPGVTRARKNVCSPPPVVYCSKFSSTF